LVVGGSWRPVLWSSVAELVPFAGAKREREREREREIPLKPQERAFRRYPGRPVAVALLREQRDSARHKDDKGRENATRGRRDTCFHVQPSGAERKRREIVNLDGRPTSITERARMTERMSVRVQRARERNV
jgi:hypothetical protein